MHAPPHCVARGVSDGHEAQVKVDDRVVEVLQGSRNGEGTKCDWWWRWTRRQNKNTRKTKPQPRTLPGRKHATSLFMTVIWPDTRSAASSDSAKGYSNAVVALVACISSWMRVAARVCRLSLAFTATLKRCAAMGNLFRRTCISDTCTKQVNAALAWNVTAGQSSVIQGQTYQLRMRLDAATHVPSPQQHNHGQLRGDTTAQREQ